jgi:hypothetical protein
MGARSSFFLSAAMFRGQLNCGMHGGTSDKPEAISANPRTTLKANLANKAISCLLLLLLLAHHLVDIVYLMLLSSRSAKHLTSQFLFNAAGRGGHGPCAGEEFDPNP